MVNVKIVYMRRHASFHRYTCVREDSSHPKENEQSYKTLKRTNDQYRVTLTEDNSDDSECFSFVKWTKMANMNLTGAHVHDRKSAAAAAAGSMTEANLHVCTSTDLPHNLEHTHSHF